MKVTVELDELNEAIAKDKSGYSSQTYNDLNAHLSKKFGLPSDAAFAENIIFLDDNIRRAHSQLMNINLGDQMAGKYLREAIQFLEKLIY